MMHPRNLIFVLLAGLTATALGIDFDRLLQVNTAVEGWVVHAGYPEFYSTRDDQYRINGKTSQSLNIYGSDIQASLSSGGRYSVLASLQPISAVKQSQRDGTFTVLDDYGELQYQVVRSTGADLKPLVSAVSDDGILALGDPVKAVIYLYDRGELVTETQIYSSTADYSMERKMFLDWMGDKLCVILERPNPINSPDQKALLIFLDRSGRDQRTHKLPFVNLLDRVPAQDHVIISGYDYDPETKTMAPEIVDVDLDGRQIWSNLFFGHELTISSNGRYVAALSSHEVIHVFELSTNKSEAIQFDHNNKASLGLAVNDQGEVAAIRVALDYFVKKDTYFTEIYFPRTGETAELQLNPRSLGLFQLYSHLDRFYIGTNYEWLGIRR